MATSYDLRQLAVSLDRLSGTIERLGQEIQIVNNRSHIGQLDKGASTQAPAKIFERAIMRAESFHRKAWPLP